jgi:uncharacterized protein (TIGR00369 family)
MAEKASPFIRKTLEAKVTLLEPGKLHMSMPFKDEFIGNPVSRVLHGGVTAALMDHVGGFCAMSAIEEGNTLMSTVDLRIDYINPAPCETIHCEAELTSRHRTMFRSDVTCWNSDRTKVIATARGLYNSFPSKIELKDRTVADSLGKDD